MQLTNFIFLAALTASLTSAHYTFIGLVNGSMVGDEWHYIPEHQRNYMPTFCEEAATLEDSRSNLGASSGAETDVSTVSSGDTAGLRQAYIAGNMAHPGPTQMYFSQALGSIKDYDEE